MELIKGNAQYSFGTFEYKKALKVLAWSVASALVTFLITLLASTEVPAQYVAFVPLVNTLLYALKEYVADNTQEVV